MREEKYAELVEKVKRWGFERGFVLSENVKEQALKLNEEWGELISALMESDEPGVMDGIGDVQVVTILLCEMLVFDYEFISAAEIDASAINPIVALGHIAEGILKNDRSKIELGLTMNLAAVGLLAVETGHDLIDCLEFSYNEIKNRTGKVIDGTYIKDEA